MASKSISQFIERPASKKSMALRKLVRGVGVNDADYAVAAMIGGHKMTCHFYAIWVDMFTRCYSKKYHSKKPTYIDCEVDKEWHLFSNFRRWMESQDWNEKEIDKDILIIGNKMYSPKTCVFVEKSINALLTHIRSSKGIYPVGVNFNDGHKSKKYISRCLVDGKRKHLGRFATPEEAGSAYNAAKHGEIMRVALLQKDERIKSGLIRHAEMVLQ